MADDHGLLIYIRCRKPGRAHNAHWGAYTVTADIVLAFWRFFDGLESNGIDAEAMKAVDE